MQLRAFVQFPAFRTSFRIFWTSLGVLISLLPFLKSVAVAAAFFAILGMQGIAPDEVLRRSLHHPETIVVPLSIVAFFAYWISVCVLGYQFARGRTLSLAAAAIVAIVALSVLVVGQPWRHMGEPMVPGVPEMLHVTFLIATAAYALVERRSRMPTLR